MGNINDQLRHRVRTIAKLAKPTSIRTLRVPASRRSSGPVRWLAPVAAVAAVAGLVVGVPVATQAAGSSSGAAVKGAVATLPNIAGTGANCIFPIESFQCYSTVNYEEFEYLMVQSSSATTNRCHSNR